MNICSRLIAITIACCFLTPVQADNDYIAALPPESVTFDLVDNTFKLVGMKKAFKEHNRILIGNYRVAFTVAESSYATEQGGAVTEQVGSNGWSTVRNYKDSEMRATVELQGVDSGDLEPARQGIPKGAGWR